MYVHTYFLFPFIFDSASKQTTEFDEIKVGLLFVFKAKSYV